MDMYTVTPEDTKVRARQQAAAAGIPDSAPAASRDDISRRAFELFLERGACDGSDVDDWLRAEREMAGN
jgi:hypothetical protein